MKSACWPFPAMSAALWRRRGAMSVALVSLLAGGCSSFERAWQSAGSSTNQIHGIAGRWEGTWRSDVNGHHDRLRCLMTPSTNGTYAARFHAEYKRLFRFTFGYTVPLTVTNGPTPGLYQFQGSANLGWYAGGNYTYAGTASATNFQSTYHSKYDHGTFQMTRPAPAN